MKTSTTRWLLALLLIGGITAFFVLGGQRYLKLEALQAAQSNLAAWVGAQPLLAGLLYAGVYVLVTALSLPGAAVLTLAGGALFGFWWALLLVSFASSIGATLAFLASRLLLRDWVRARFGARLQAIESGFERDGAFYLLSLRLVPAVPFFVVNLLLGLTPIRTGTFYLVSQLGMLPGTAVFVLAGTQLAQIRSVGDVLSPGLFGALLALGLLPLVLKMLLAWWERRKRYAKWPRPRKFDYNLIVIGAGAAGLVSSYIGAAVKAKVALIEAGSMGGDCLNTGCVPSKALIRAARLLHEARHSQELGIRSMQSQFEFTELMQRVHQVITRIEPHDSVERYTGLGVECLQGYARIVSPWEVELNGKRLSARSLIIATGAEPLVPGLPGLAEASPLTSENLWELKALPKRLMVLGGGPIGCELAQAFARIGAEVTVLELAPRLLPREDACAGELLAERLRAEGIKVLVGHQALAFPDAHHVRVKGPEGEQLLEFDRILVALGRKARVRGFGLEELGIRLDPQGRVAADALMRTNFPNISVCGDVTGPFQFTHVAAHQAWYAVVNQLLAPFKSFAVDYRVIPWVTYTDPEIARVGLSEDEAKAAGKAYELSEYQLDDLDRAIADGATTGVVRVLTRPGSDQILGATIIGAHAGELIAEFVLAMKYRLGLNKILGTIHAYPTLMEANKYVAGVWKKAHAPQGVLRWAEKYWRWRRG